MQNPSNSFSPVKQTSADIEHQFRVEQRVHWIGDTRRTGTVKYVGPVEGYSGIWIGVDWDNGDGKHDGSHNGVKYFAARGPKTASLVRPHNLSTGISLLQALEVRYRAVSTKEEEDEMYVLSARNKRVSVELLGKEKIQDKVSQFEELTSASLSYLGVSSSGFPGDISSTLPHLQELDLTGNLLAGWEDVGIICKALPSLAALNLSYNSLSPLVTTTPLLNKIRILVLNHTGVIWKQVEVLKDLLPCIEELHLLGNKVSEITEVFEEKENVPGEIILSNFLYACKTDGNIQNMADWSDELRLVLRKPGWCGNEFIGFGKFIFERAGGLWHLLSNVVNTTSIKGMQPVSSPVVQGFDSLRLLNLEDNCIADWEDILKLSQLKSLEQLFLNKNYLNRICYPDCGSIHESENDYESLDVNLRPFKTVRCLLLGGNKIEDLDSVDSLNSFPNLVDIRLSENPVADIGRGGVPRFVLIARLAKVEVLNGSEVSPRERKDSEIRYVRLVMSKFHDYPEEVKRLHPRFAELKKLYGIEDERPLTGTAGPQKMASGLISASFKCIGVSMGEKAPLMKKLPATTTVGKLKSLCQSFFKLNSVNLVLYLQEEGSPLPTLLEDDMASLIELGVGNESTILVDEE